MPVVGVGMIGGGEGEADAETDLNGVIYSNDTFQQQSIFDVSSVLTGPGDQHIQHIFFMHPSSQWT